jgi:hypothetical protein
MRVLIAVQAKHITIDDVPLQVNAMPSDLEYPPEEQQASSRRPLLQVEWVGGVLTVIRHPRVPGRHDVEHFGSDGLSRITGFINAYDVEKARLDEERRKQAEQAERDAAESARINAEREGDDQEAHERQLAHEAREAADRQERLDAEAKAQELNPPPVPEEAQKPAPG